MDAKTLSGILGHTNASFTLGTYAHITDDMQRTAAQIDRGIGKRAAIAVSLQVQGMYKSSLYSAVPFFGINSVWVAAFSSSSSASFRWTPPP